jgi:hypothetical protein
MYGGMEDDQKPSWELFVKAVSLWGDYRFLNFS